MPQAHDPHEPNPMLALEIQGIVHGLENGRTYLVGRGAVCDIRIDHESAAEVHALIHVRGQRVVIEDRSAGWTFVDGMEVQKKALHPDERVVFGSVSAALAEGSPDLSLATDPSPAAHSVATPVADATTADAPAVRTPGKASGAASRPLRFADETTFSEHMADELRRAPWFGLSLLMHVGLFLLLLWFLRNPEVGRKLDAQFGIAGLQGDPAEEVGSLDAEPFEVEETNADEQIDLVDESFVDEPAFDEPPPDPTLPGDLIPKDVLEARIRLTKPAEDILKGGHAGLESGGFKDRIAEIREAGLEIVFVYDSTGSMGRVLEATRDRIVRTLEVLQTLVPGARVGIVTYRDHGQREEYLTRHVPLAQDFYRAVNFCQIIRADGGGDEPEAVLDGLQRAVKQPWTRGAKRIIVLVGDAPAHYRTMPAIVRAARKFSTRGLSKIHTVVTKRSTYRERPDAAAIESFREIALAGRGECVMFDDEEALLQRILTLAFGKQYEDNVDYVYRLVDKRRKANSGLADTVARRPKQVVAALREQPVPHALVESVIERERREMVSALAQVAMSDDFPSHGRHAAAYALQQLLDLPAPPLSPDTEQPLNPAAAFAPDKSSRVRKVLERIGRQRFSR